MVKALALTNTSTPSKPQIKLQKLPETKPVKYTVSVMPDLEAYLEAYAKVYEEAYGEKVDIAALIPSMLTSAATSGSVTTICERGCPTVRKL